MNFAGNHMPVISKVPDTKHGKCAKHHDNDNDYNDNDNDGDNNDNDDNDYDNDYD